MSVEVKEVVGSNKYQFNKQDLMKVLKNGAMVGLAAILTYIVQNLGNVEMGPSLVVVLPLITMGLNSAIRWLMDYSNVTTEVVETK